MPACEPEAVVDEPPDLSLMQPVSYKRRMPVETACQLRSITFLIKVGLLSTQRTNRPSFVVFILRLRNKTPVATPQLEPGYERVAAGNRRTDMCSGTMIYTLSLGHYLYL
jgi:hypothetical protein